MYNSKSLRESFIIKSSLAINSFVTLAVTFQQDLLI